MGTPVGLCCLADFPFLRCDVLAVGARLLICVTPETPSNLTLKWRAGGRWHNAIRSALNKATKEQGQMADSETIPQRTGILMNKGYKRWRQS